MKRNKSQFSRLLELDKRIRQGKNGDIKLSVSAAGVYEVFRWVKVLAPTELKKVVDDEITAMCKVRQGKRKR